MPNHFIPHSPFYNNYRYPSPMIPKKPIYAPNLNTQDTLPKQESSNNQSNCEDSSTRSCDKQDFLFEFFGIKLSFDDILLLCIIFFMYSEGVKDEMLFVSLILLLLS